MKKTLQIAIDGPAGAGKSSVAKVLAKKLNCLYLDTGAMYRAVTWLAMEQKIDLNDPEEVEHLLATIEIEFKEIAGEQHLFCNGKDVTELIRSSEISGNVSKIAAIPMVREKMVARQQEIAADHDVLMDGRDIGTTVLPNAEYKFFLTASLEERARRRFEQDVEKGKHPNLEEVKEQIAKRDDFDSKREVSPLVQAPDAEFIDTSDLTFEEVVEKLFQKIEK